MRTSKVGCVLVAGGLFASACTQTPGAPSVSFAAPVASSPSNGTSFKFSQQPITLSFANAVRTSAADAKSSVEVASDSGFGTTVFTLGDIAENGSGTTTVQINQTLAGPATYYWRSMTTIEGVTGAPSPTRSFAVGPPVTINVPNPLNPANNGTASNARPSFVVSNASRSGPAGTLVYEFQVSGSSSFSPLVVSGTATEQASETSWTPGSDIPVGNYFWRVRATDPTNDVQGGFTDARPFRLEPFSLKNATIWNNPADIGSWAETATIDWIDFSTGHIVVDFSKRLGAGRWPDVTPAGWSGALQYTLGLCGNISGQWHCSAAIQFWHGRDLTEGGLTHLVWADWFYDRRWGAMLGYQPKNGENVGFFVIAGNVRDDPAVAVFERSNVQFTPWGTNWVRK